MAKKQTRKKRPFKASRIWVIAGIVLLILIAGVSTYLLTRKPKNNNPAVNLTNQPNTRPYPSATAQDNANNNTRKGSSSPAQTLDNGPTTSGSSTSTPAPSNTTISVLVTRAGVLSKSGVNTLEVGTQVSGATAGSCVLTVSQSGEQSVTQTNSIELQNNAYTCPVFDIPTSQFPNQGTWNVSVTVTSNGTSASNSWGTVDLSD
jgi:hypothetical protein